MPIEAGAPTPRPMLVAVLADTSGSMGVDGKIDVLNDAVERMVRAFQQLDVPGCEIRMAVITFGGNGASVHLPPTPVADVDLAALTAGGGTPMGGAFELARAMLDDKDVLPDRSHPPNLVLVSDGIPTDDWQKPLQMLDAGDQARRALRFAVGVGADARADVLSKFAGDLGEVVPVSQVEMLTEFFRYVTQTITQAVQRPGQSQADLPTFVDYSPSDAVEF